MNICHVMEHSCIRVHKLATAQALAGHTCYLISRNFSCHHPWWQYTAVFRMFEHNGNIVTNFWESPVKLLGDKVDLYHIHNERNWMVPEFRKFTDKPIIYDVHDLTSAVRGEDPDEDSSFRDCNGIMTVSEGVKELIQKKTPKPIHVYYSTAVEDWIPEESSGGGGLIYTGAIGGELPYRQWGQVLCDLEDLGLPVTCLAADAGQFLRLPRPLKMNFIQKAIDYLPMIRRISEADASLVGFPILHNAGYHALPNKFWDSMAAGTPVICLNAPEMEGFIRFYGVGLNVPEASDIPEAIKHIQNDVTYRTRARRLGREFSMNRQLPGIMKFYESVMESK